jgi:hypothetical protein
MTCNAITLKTATGCALWIELRFTEIDALVRIALLKAETRNDPNAISEAFYRDRTSDLALLPGRWVYPAGVAGAGTVLGNRAGGPRYKPISLLSCAVCE